MIYGEILKVALVALRANKLRSALTMLGIVIGVAAVIAVVALGRGAQEAVNERIQALGTTLLLLSVDSYRAPDWHQAGYDASSKESRARQEMPSSSIAEKPLLMRLRLSMQAKMRSAFPASQSSLSKGS